jgi:hypothetical protein
LRVLAGGAFGNFIEPLAGMTWVRVAEFGERAEEMVVPRSPSEATKPRMEKASINPL